MMMSNMKSLSILTYDRIRFNVNIFKEKSTMKLLNVCYVFDFMINIVANSILENKDVHFNTKHRHLYRKETQISLVFVSRVDAHYVLEDNRSEEMSIFAVFVRKDTTSKEVAEEIKLTNKNKMFLINKCEEYAFFKAHEIVFKSFEKTESSSSNESTLMLTSFIHQKRNSSKSQQSQ